MEPIQNISSLNLSPQNISKHILSATKLITTKHILSATKLIITKHILSATKLITTKHILSATKLITTKLILSATKLITTKHIKTYLISDQTYQTTNLIKLNKQIFKRKFGKRSVSRPLSW